MISNLKNLLELMSSNGVKKLYVKKLAPNDNSKNQIYLGGNFLSLNVIPHEDVVVDQSDKSGSKRDRAKAKVNFHWLDEYGKYVAPNTQLILYSKYPEVRMSGFLQGCKNSPSKLISSRQEGRMLFFGIKEDGEVLGYVTSADNLISKKINSMKNISDIGVFEEIQLNKPNDNSKDLLLKKILEIHEKKWINSKRLTRDGIPKPYKAQNGGGYTLEAELGVTPNGYSEPDYLGWEVKQYGVKDFINYKDLNKISLMTPEPNDGIYKKEGIKNFLMTFGYPDKRGAEDKINFGGVYSSTNDYNPNTKLKLFIEGFNFDKGIIDDIGGGIFLKTINGDEAAIWRFSSLIDHWNRKHAKAVYIPSLRMQDPRKYFYGSRILLCEGTDFNLFLKSLIDSFVVIDPGTSMKKASTLKPVIKKRNQFRIDFANLKSLYFDTEVLDLL